MSGRLKGYDLLKSVIHLFGSSMPFEAKLEQMLNLVSQAFQAERCLILWPEKIAHDGFLHRLASERRTLWVEEESSFEKRGVLPEEEDLLLPAFACFPLYEEASFEGIFYIGFPEKRIFSEEEANLLPLVANVMEGAIRNHHLLAAAKRTDSELTALREIGKSVTSTLKVEKLFELIVSTGSKILKARGGVLRLQDPGTKELQVKWSLGNCHQNSLDERIAARVFYTRTPVVLNHFGEEGPSLSVLCAPLLSKGKAFGTLSFYNKEGDPSKFDERDFHLLLTVAGQTSGAIENALTHHDTSHMALEHEKMVGQLSSLWELNKALLTTVNFERILHTILTAITIGDGLGFNRAMLFLLNEKEGYLEGAMAVGPNSPEEAGRIWTFLSQKTGHPSDLITQLESSPQNDSVLNSVVKGIKIPLDQAECILSRTVLEGRPFNIEPSQGVEGWIQTRCEKGCCLSSEVACFVGEHLGHDPKVHSFATVPLWGKGKVIGVILVDNLYNQKPITEKDIHFLSMFSNQAGLAIENAILYRKLEEVHQELKETQNLLVYREKLAALGELCNSVAHEIKNPIVSIGGFARRLYRVIPDEAPEKRYTQTIMIEVARLERIIGDLYHYTREESMVYKECNLSDIVEDSLSMVSERYEDEGIELLKQYVENVPKVKGDYQQLKQVFFNLVDNAYQAMKDGGMLSLRIHPIAKNGSSFVRVEVEDTGGGIDPENLHNIFNPFYSTKESGLGLGLPIVHRIITSHHGQIEVDNNPGKGVTFIVTLPALEAEMDGTEAVR
jgi:two-component system sensor histidine kinase HydH